jgi:hypothetical protein
VLTVNRGLEQVKATNRIGAVAGVAADWSLLDNFDFYSPGSLAANGWWVDVASGSSVSVVASSFNRMVKTTISGAGAYLKLNNLSVSSNQSCTLFFRLMLPAASPSEVIRQYVGITDKPGNFVYQYQSNVGPADRPTVNDPSQNPGDWLLSAVSMPSSPAVFATNILQPGAVYSVWIDVTNVFIGDRALENMDVFSIHIQKEGDESRTTVFENYVSDRDLSLDDPLTGGVPTDNLNRIYLCGAGTESALYDDFYLSKSGYNAGIPRAFGYSGPPPGLQLQWSGSQWQIHFQGKLLEATSLSGSWNEVIGATSPYPVPTTGEMKFYRSVVP